MARLMLFSLFCLVSVVYGMDAKFEALSHSVHVNPPKLLSWLMAPGASPVSKRVCIVDSPDLVPLSAQLAARGHKVTFAHFANENAPAVAPTVQLLTLPAPGQSQGNFGVEYERSLTAYRALKSHQDFDVIVFSSHSGVAYFCEEAKRAGLHFDRTALVVQATPESRAESDLETIQGKVARFLYRRSIALADAAFVMEPASMDAVRFYERNVVVWSTANVEGAVSLVEAQKPVPAHQITETPVVSVVIAAYNRPELLREAIASVRAQSYRHVEIIVVDDGSTVPEMAPVLAALEREDVIVVRQTNQYLGAARNTGARQAKGKYLLFLDDDNVMLPTMIESLVRAASLSKSVVAVNAHYVWAAPAHTPLPKSYDGIVSWTPVGPARIAGVQGNVFGNANFLVEREAFYQMSGFSEDRAGAEDYEFHAKACMAGLDYVVVPEPLMLYRMHSNQQMYQTMDKKKAMRRAMRAYSDQLEMEAEVPGHNFGDRVVTSCAVDSAAFPNTATTTDCTALVVRVFTVDDGAQGQSGYTPQSAAPTIFVTTASLGTAGRVEVTGATCSKLTAVGDTNRVAWQCVLSAGVPALSGADGGTTVQLIFQATFDTGSATIDCAQAQSEPCRVPSGVCFHEDTHIEYNGKSHSMDEFNARSDCTIPHVISAVGVQVATTCSDKPLRLTKSHLVYSNKGLVHASHLAKGDVVYSNLEQTSECTVKSVTEESKPQKYFGLNCLKSVVVADNVKTSTFGDYHTVLAIWMKVVGSVAGIERASRWGVALADTAQNLGLLQYGN